MDTTGRRQSPNIVRAEPYLPTYSEGLKEYGVEDKALADAWEELNRQYAEMLKNPPAPNLKKRTRHLTIEDNPGLGPSFRARAINARVPAVQAQIQKETTERNVAPHLEEMSDMLELILRGLSGKK